MAQASGRDCSTWGQHPCHPLLDPRTYEGTQFKRLSGLYPSGPFTTIHVSTEEARPTHPRKLLPAEEGHTCPRACCSSVGCPTNRTLSIFSSNFWPHISDLVAKIVARITSENLQILERQDGKCINEHHSTVPSTHRGSGSRMTVLWSYFVPSGWHVYQRLSCSNPKGRDVKSPELQVEGRRSTG